MVIDEAIPSREPFQRIVMEDDRDAVFREMDVALDRVIVPDGFPECGKRVFPAGLVEIVQAAMRDRSFGKTWNAEPWTISPL
jgi:hypothetical protein